MNTLKPEATPAMRLKPKIEILTLDSTPHLDPSSSLTKPTLIPFFPGLKQKPARIMPGTPKLKLNNSPMNSGRLPSSNLGLFPVGSFSDSVSNLHVGRIGVGPSLLAVSDRHSQFAKVPSLRKELLKLSEADISSPRSRRKGTRLLKDENESNFEWGKQEEFGQNQEFQISKADHKKTLYKRIQTGRITLENVVSADLVELSLDALKKHKNQRGMIDTAILVQCLHNTVFFKDLDKKTLESCVRAMSHVFLSRGETVFNIGDSGTQVWVLLRGLIEIQQSGPKTNGPFPIIQQSMLFPGVHTFGEQELLNPDSKRECLVLCKENSEFALLEKAEYERILEEKLTRKLIEDINFLGSLPCLKTWTHRSIKEFFYQAPICSYKRGNILYDEGVESDKMYIVKNGKFKILKEIKIKRDDSDGLQFEQKGLKKQEQIKKIVEVAVLGEKEIFGEEGLLNSEKRKYKVICESLEAEAFEVSKKEFLKLLKHSVTRTWLEEYSKSKQNFYEERIESVRKATKKHKHLLLFTKMSPLNSPPISIKGISENVPSLLFSKMNQLKEQLLGTSEGVSKENFSMLSSSKHHPKEFCSFPEETEISNFLQESQIPTSRLQRTGSNLILSNLESPRNLTKKENDNPSSLFQTSNLLSGKKTTMSQIKNKSVLFQKSMPTSPRESRLKKYQSQTFRESTEKLNEISAKEEKEKTKESPRKKQIKSPKLKIALEMIDRSEVENVQTAKSTHRELVSSLKTRNNSCKVLKMPDTPEAKILLSERSSQVYSSYLFGKSPRGEKVSIQSPMERSDGFGWTVYSHSTEKAVTPQVGEGRMIAKNRTGQIFEMKEKNFQNINWEQQRQKIKKMVEERASKEYRRFFYSIEGEVQISRQKSEKTGLMLDQIKAKEDDLAAKKSPKGVLKGIKYEPKIDQNKKNFNLNGKSLA